MRNVRAGGLLTLLLLASCSGGDPAEPGSGDSDVALDSSIDTNPADDTAVPDSTIDDTTIDDTTAPDSADDTTAPDSADDSTAPDTADASTSPDAADDSSADSTLGDTEVDSSTGDTAMASDTADADDTLDTLDTLDTAPPDTAPVVDDLKSTIWMYGGFAGSGDNALGRHDFATATTTKLGVGMWSFDISVAGNLVAFSSAVFVNGRFDVWTMNGDGTGAHPLVQFPGQGRASSVKVSPDGKYVAYIADVANNGLKDAYLVPSTGGTPVKISPPRSSTIFDQKQLQPDNLFWSPDSKFVGLVGVYNAVNMHQIWLVDPVATAPTPRTVLSSTDVGTLGMGADPALPVAFGTGDRLIFRGRMQVDGKPFLYQVKTDGTALSKIPGPVTTANVSTFGVSRDGTKIAFASDAALANAYEIYVMPSTGTSGTPDRVTSGLVPANQGPISIYPLYFSPAGDHIAFISNIGTGTEKEPFVVSTTPGGVTRRLAQTNRTGTVGLAWSPEGKEVAVLADVNAVNKFELFRLKITDTDQVPTLVEPATKLSEVRWSMPPTAAAPYPSDAGYDVGYADPLVTDGAIVGTSRMWFTADWVYSSNPMLGRYDYPGGPTRQIFHDTVEVKTLTVAPNGSRAVVTAELEKPLDFDLWSVKADGTGLVKLAEGRPDSYGFTDVIVSPDSTRVAFTEYTAAAETYVAPLAGGVAPVKVSGTPVMYPGSFPGVNDYAFSPDGNTLAICAYYEDRNTPNVYFVDLTTSPPTRTAPVAITEWSSSSAPFIYGGPKTAPAWINNNEVVVGGSHKTLGSGYFSVSKTGSVPTKIAGSSSSYSSLFKISPDGAYIAYPDSSTGVVNVLSVAGGTPVPHTPSSTQIYAFAWKPDSTAIAFIGKHTSFPNFSIQTVPLSTTPSPAPTTLATRTMTGSLSVSGFTWSPAGDNIAFIADLGTSSIPNRNVWRLNNATSTGQPLTAVHAPTTSTMTVQYLHWTP